MGYSPWGQKGSGTRLKRLSIRHILFFSILSAFSTFNQISVTCNQKRADSCSHLRAGAWVSWEVLMGTLAGLR